MKYIPVYNFISNRVQSYLSSQKIIGCRKRFATKEYLIKSKKKSIGKDKVVFGIYENLLFTASHNYML